MESKKGDVLKYLQVTVNPILKPIVEEIVKTRPTNIMQFIFQFAKKQISSAKEKPNDITHQLSQQSDPQISKEQAEQIQKKIAQKLQGKSGKKKVSRRGISAQVFGDYNKKSAFVAKVYKKSQESASFLKDLLKHSIMFMSLNEENLKIVIDAMQERKTKQNQHLITQGEDGDVLYVIGSGEYQCSKIIDGKKTYLKTYKTGQLFGQLSLMYNAKRAASVKCIKSGIVYALDCQTFNNIVQESAIKRRKEYSQIINRIQILSEVKSCEKQQLCDAFKQERFQPNQYVMKEGDDGDKLFFIVQGNLVAEKENAKLGKKQIVYKYKDKEYFGELALIRNTVRQASVRAVTKCKLLSIGRQQFKRLLGPIEDILNRNAEKYKKFLSS